MRSGLAPVVVMKTGVRRRLVGKRAELYGVGLLWAAILVLTAFVAGAVKADWLIFVPLACGLVHALAVVTRR